MNHFKAWTLASLVVMVAGCQKTEEYPNPTQGGTKAPSQEHAPSAAPPAPTPAAPPGGAAAPAPAPAPGAAPAAPANPTVAAALKVTAPSAEAVTEAKNKFNTLCATCHGPNGDGNGPAAAAFPVKPRNYHDKAWQAATSDTEIMTAILEGGGAVGKSPLMPANPDLDKKPDELAALKDMVRSFGK